MRNGRKLRASIENRTSTRSQTAQAHVESPMQITQIQLEVLRKGWKFIPTTKSKKIMDSIADTEESSRGVLIITKQISMRVE